MTYLKLFNSSVFSPKANSNAVHAFVPNNDIPSVFLPITLLNIDFSQLIYFQYAAYRINRPHLLKVCYFFDRHKTEALQHYRTVVRSKLYCAIFIEYNVVVIFYAREFLICHFYLPVRKNVYLVFF